MLSGCRALDLTDEKGFLAGHILACLGVDVIKVERPGGDPSRRIGPFYDDIPDPQKSLYWFAYNANKRGITLDIETRDGKRLFKELVKTADFVIESFDPGYLDGLGLGYEALREVNPGIILTSITAYGQTGPYHDYKASDIVLMGMGGELFLTGDSDRPPVNVSLPQSWLHGAADGAVGALIAYYHKENTGEGQRVDVSIQQSVAWFLATTIPYWELDQIVLGRVGTFRSGSSSGTVQRQVWECKDGFVFFFMIGGMQGAKTCRQLVKWMADEGRADAYLSNMEWERFDMATATQEEIDRISAPIMAFFRSHTKQEILDAAIGRNVSVCPLSGMKDLMRDANLRERGFWIEIEHPELNGHLEYPRQFIRSSEGPIGTRFRAPLIGEHNTEVYGEMGLSGQTLVGMKTAGII
jgi:crotonobetainyl-CoA:carnitine CoA-transferase CaiB-like acyl-CoA transferase